MGYRSDWQLIFNAADCYKLQTVLDWLDDYSKQSRGGSSLVEEILLNARRDDGTDYVIFSDDGWKLYNWEEMIDDIEAQFGADEEVDVAYAVVGEDLDDMTVQNGEYTSVYIARTIDSPYLDQVPRNMKMAENADPFEPVPDPNPRRVEEKCGHCGRMKDANQSCWWCGN